MSKGMLIVLSGPSGVGKGTVLSEVFKKDGNLAYSVSCTTRPPRPGEQDGVHYHFITAEQFKSNIDCGRMLEYTIYCDNYYGTDAKLVDDLRNSGKDVVLEIETQGCSNILKKCPDAVTIFIAPPTFEALKSRLMSRGTEDTEVIRKRIERAGEEISRIPAYEYLVINDELDSAVDDVLTILRAERIKKYNKSKFIF